MTDIRTFESIDELSEAAADELIAICSEAVHERGVAHVALSGGSTPKKLFQILAKRGRDAAPWDQIHLWWGDERSVGPEHADSNFKMTKDNLLVPLKLEKFERIEGEKDPVESAKQYRGKLAGRITRRMVVAVPAPRVSDASSRLRSTWLRLAMPARMPTGMFRNTKAITMMIAVPVSWIGGVLKARM